MTTKNRYSAILEDIRFFSNIDANFIPSIFVQLLCTATKKTYFYIYETIYEPNMASDFVREAVRDKLKATKVVKTRDIDYEEAKKEVLDYGLVWAITEELKRDKKLRFIS
ncbi:hypothetical protein ES705_33721 [subsurface metagenome]